jgi:hypothetical protein
MFRVNKKIITPEVEINFASPYTKRVETILSFLFPQMRNFREMLEASVRKSIVLIIFKEPKTAKTLQITIVINKWSQKLPKLFFSLPKQKKSSIKIN